MTCQKVGCDNYSLIFHNDVQKLLKTLVFDFFTMFCVV